MSKRRFALPITLASVIGLLVFFYNSSDSMFQANSPSQPSYSVNVEAGTYQDISPEKLNNWLNTGKDILLIDVREPWEYQDGYLKGAVNIPLGQLESRLKEIAKNKEAVVYCRSGRRSAEASKILVKNGYQKVFNLEGGIINWPFEIVKQ